MYLDASFQKTSYAVAHMTSTHSCKTHIAGDAAFCHSCGSPLAAQLYIDVQPEGGLGGLQGADGETHKGFALEVRALHWLASPLHCLLH